MAERRMFAKSIVLSDAFLDMPLSARCLYFTLGMLADDDGFIGNPKAIMRQCGASQDDMIILLQKRYILSFESGVIVIKHWRLNNYLKSDRYKGTTYVEEKAELAFDEKGAYTEKKDVNYGKIEVEGKDFIEVPSISLSDARQARAKAKKESSLPTTFDAQIRNAFVGKRCPICNVIMTYEFNTTKPTIQHNLPISKGGKHELDNISVICQSCNTSIQNKVETPPYNTDEVKKIWECLGNGYTGKDSIGKDSIGKNINNNIYNNNINNTLVSSGDDTNENPSENPSKNPSENPSDDTEKILRNDFEIIYSLYPKKGTKQSAFESYKKWVQKSGRKVGGKIYHLTNKQIWDAVKNYVTIQENNGTQLEYYKNFVTLMNQLLDWVIDDE